MDIYSINLYVTEDCNLRCSYCFVKRKRTYLSLETGKQTIDYLLNQPNLEKPIRISFFGGEPLLRFELIKKLVLYAEKKASQFNKKVHFGIVTNGILVSDKILSFLKKHNFHLKLSIDGDKISHDMYRKTRNGSGTFIKIKKKLEKIKNYFPYPSVRATVMPETSKYLLENLEFFIKEGFRRIGLYPALEANWTKKYFSILEKQLNLAADLYIKLFKENQRILILPLQNTIGIIANKKPLICGAGKHFVGISPQGEIFPCHRFFAYSKSFPLGNVWKGITNKRKREGFLKLNPATVKVEKCKNCSLAKWGCFVGCYALNYEINKSLINPHENYCKFQHLIFPIAKRIIKEIHDSRRNNKKTIR